MIDTGSSGTEATLVGNPIGTASMHTKVSLFGTLMETADEAVPGATHPWGIRSWLAT